MSARLHIAGVGASAGGLEAMLPMIISLSHLPPRGVRGKCVSVSVRAI